MTIKRTKAGVRAITQATAWGEALVLASQRTQEAGKSPLHVELDEHGIPHVIRQRGDDVPKCKAFQTKELLCTRDAGVGTIHPGTGPCSLHGGNSRKERVAGIIMTAHAISKIMDVDPWEAIEIAMRRAYAWSAFYQAKLATVTDDDDLRPGGAAYDWVRASERTTEVSAKYAKMAHDMGVAERHVRAVELQGTMIAQVLSATLHELGLGDETEDKARAIMDLQLRMLAEQGRATIVSGEVVHTTDSSIVMPQNVTKRVEHTLPPPPPDEEYGYTDD